MSTFEENWEVGVVVTAEAVFGIGFCGETIVAVEDRNAWQELPENEAYEGAAD